MLRATAIVRKPAVKAERVADTVTLDHRGRNVRAAALTGANGLAFLLDLDREAALNDGDALKLEDGRLVAVRAAPERLLEVRAENPARLLKAAFQAGSRHVPTEITAEALYLEDDPALAELVRGEGCSATPVTRPFRPERDLHAHDCGHDHHGHHHGHDHHAHEQHHHDHHGHDHSHDHAHEHHHRGHDHGHGHAHENQHGKHEHR